MVDPNRVQAVFDRAVELPMEQRRDSLLEEYNGDLALFDEVARLLDVERHSDSFLGSRQPLT